MTPKDPSKLSVSFTSAPEAGIRKLCLTLTKPQPGPTLDEREAWRLMFQVPLFTFAYTASETTREGEVIKTVQYEWTEPVEPAMVSLPWLTIPKE